MKWLKRLLGLDEKMTWNVVEEDLARLIEEAAGDADCPSRQAVIEMVEGWVVDQFDVALDTHQINTLIDTMLKDGRLVSDGSCLVSVAWRPNTAARIKAGKAGISAWLNESVESIKGCISEVCHSITSHNYEICAHGSCSFIACPIPKELIGVQ